MLERDSVRKHCGQSSTNCTFEKKKHTQQQCDKVGAALETQII